MSVIVNHVPRFYARHNSGTLKNPPECSCDAVLLERKFVAASGPPPPVDAERLAQSLTFRAEVQRSFTLCVYRDRLLFRSHNRTPDLPDIFFDDLIQVEQLPGRQSVLFLLCGRRSVGAYYFFKLSDYTIADRIKYFAGRVNPDIVHVREGYDTSMQNFNRHRIYEQQPPKENIRDYGNHRVQRDFSAPSSVYSDGTYDTPSSPILRQNSFIRWEGDHRSGGRHNGGRSIQGRQTPFQLFQSPSSSRSHSPRRDNEKTVFIKARGTGTVRRKPTSMRNKRQPLLLLDDNHTQTKSIGQPASEHMHNSRRRHRASAGRRRSSKHHRPRTFILEDSSEDSYKPSAPVQRNYIPSNESDSSISTFDLADEIQVGRHRYATGPQLRNVEYQGGNMDDYDWESTDSWDLADAKSMGDLRGVSFNMPRTVLGPSREGAYNMDDVSSSSEDSLYLEREEQQFGMQFPQRQTNYLPELQQKFRQFNLN